MTYREYIFDGRPPEEIAVGKPTMVTDRLGAYVGIIEEIEVYEAPEDGAAVAKVTTRELPVP